MLAEQDRLWFDEQLDTVVKGLPKLVKDLMEEVPMIVDDLPTRQQLHSVGLSDPESLCGLYVGVSLDRKTFESSREPSDKVYLFRAGILHEASEPDGTVFDDRLRDEIRKTILHEYGHHHGMDENELEELGY